MLANVNLLFFGTWLQISDQRTLKIDLTERFTLESDILAVVKFTP